MFLFIIIYSLVLLTLLIINHKIAIKEKKFKENLKEEVFV